MGKMTHHDNLRVVVHLDTGAHHLEGVTLAKRPVRQLDRIVVDGFELVNQGPSCVPRIQRRDSERRLLEMPGFRGGGKLLERQTAKVAIVGRLFRAARARERNAQAALRLHVAPFCPQAVIGDEHISRYSCDQFVVQSPRHNGHLHARDCLLAFLPRLYY